MPINAVVIARVHIMMMGNIRETLCKILVMKGTTIIPVVLNTEQMEIACDLNGVANNSNDQVKMTQNETMINKRAMKAITMVT